MLCPSWAHLLKPKLEECDATRKCNASALLNSALWSRHSVIVVLQSSVSRSQRARFPQKIKDFFGRRNMDSRKTTTASYVFHQQLLQIAHVFWKVFGLNQFPVTTTSLPVGSTASHRQTCTSLEVAFGIWNMFLFLFQCSNTMRYYY